jgi:hypothetical protein
LLVVAAGVTVSLTGASVATITTDASGSYSFAGLADGDYVVTPTLTGYAFNPASSAVTISGGSVSGRSFTSVAVPFAFRSCREVRQAGLPDGTYSIDPDGNGALASVYCPTSSPHLAPVGLCQAEVGATPACRSYVGAAGFDFAGVDFSKPLHYTNTALTIGGTTVPGNGDLIKLADDSLLTVAGDWAYANKVAPDGTLSRFGEVLSGALGITQLFDRTILVGLGNTARTFSVDGLFQRSVDSSSYTFMQDASGLVWAPVHGTNRIDLYLPDLITVAYTVTHPTGSPWDSWVLQLADGGYLVTNPPGQAYGAATGPSTFSFLKPDRTPVSFTVAPNGMTLNSDGTLYRPDLVLAYGILQLPNRQILIADP